MFKSREKFSFNISGDGCVCEWGGGGPEVTFMSCDFDKPGDGIVHPLVHCGKDPPILLANMIYIHLWGIKM